MKIGFFGGTFDPFTLAHKAIVEKVLEEGIVDKVVIVPTVVNYHRVGYTPWLSDKGRVDVIRQMMMNHLEKDVYIEVNEIDKKNSYENNAARDLFCKSRRFIHTLNDLIPGYLMTGDVDNGYYTIIGTDQYEHFTDWFMWQDILKLTKLVVIDGRNGRNTVAVNEFQRPPVPVYRSVEIPIEYANVSASEIRNKYVGHKRVEEYLEEVKRKEEKLLFRTPIFDLIEKKEVQPNFKPVGINAPDWVTVVAMHRGDVILVNQLRYGTMRRYDEYICGEVESGETPEHAARRELLEETGLSTTNQFKKLGSFWTNPAFMNNRMHIFLVELDDADLERREDQCLDEHEKIVVSRMMFSELATDVWSKDSSHPAFMALATALVEKKMNESVNCLPERN